MIDLNLLFVKNDQNIKKGTQSVLLHDNTPSHTAKPVETLGWEIHTFACGLLTRSDSNRLLLI